MYLRILKKDLKRKKTMNLILFIFIVLAAAFISSSANNMITVSTALDSFMEKSDVPDYWFASMNNGELESFETLAKEKDYGYTTAEMLQIDPKKVYIEGERFQYSNTLALADLEGTKVFDKNNELINEVKEGEIYVTWHIFSSLENDFHEGGKILIDTGEVKKEFIIKGYVKDVCYGSAMVGITRFLVNQKDFDLFNTEDTTVISSVSVYTDDPEYNDNFNALELNVVMQVDRSMVKMMYIMDMLISAVMLVVSVCLILISMVILRFIINFTITEEFREIGVMKAIGITNLSIGGLYIAKYFAIAVFGTVLGLILGFPFGKLMIENVTKKIVISGEDNFFINIAAAVLTAGIVVLFCLLCTRKIRNFSPIDAIRSGETGERYSKKGFIRLSRSKLNTVVFMAVNDILSGIKKYISMILIFILGTLLIIVPVNTINTLRSDKLLTMFNMSKSDYVISQELLFRADISNYDRIIGEHEKIREALRKEGVEAKVYQEVLFRGNVSKNGKRTNSLSFQGVGDVTADMYIYLEGTAPRNTNEVAITYLTAEQIGASIGDDVEINIGGTTKTYIITAMYQSMNNMGEGVRFHHDEELDYAYAAGSFGIQVSFDDSPDENELERRKEILQKLYPDSDIYDAIGYISYMIGDVAGQLDSLKTLILGIILCINILVAVLMMKSFIAKEKSEIALLKAIGFDNGTLSLWQTLRIGIVLIVSVITGALVSSPLSNLIITPVFRMMGAYSVEYDIIPLEVYVLYPLILLAATAAAAFISAQGLRKITASETSNVE